MGITFTPPMDESMKRARVEIDLGALQRNGAALQRHAGVPLLPMVKADAYGLGVREVVRALEKLDPWGYGVATVVEGEELRGFGIERRILVFTPILAEEMTAAAKADLTPVLGDANAIAAWRKYGGGKPWHYSIDTGMSRAGAHWRDVVSLPAKMDAEAEGVCTHFHSAELDDGSMEEQEKRFESALAKLDFTPKYTHTDNSAAIARHGRSTRSFVRPGIFLYGAGSGAKLQPEPVVSLSAPIVEIREIGRGDTVSYDATFRASGRTRIATIALGYADGYPRALSNIGKASVNGKLVPIAGIVTMDMIMLDVSAIDCEIGDVAFLLGRDGENLLTVEDVAAPASISPYEFLTGLRSRIERVYTGGES